MIKYEWPELAGANHAAWETNAAHWDDYMGDDGNDFHRQLVRPAVMKLLDPRPGERMLDIGCGNGLFARHLAAQGASVVATDVSAALIERARARTAGGAVTYAVVDATDRDALLALGRGRFDAAVANMVLMDLAEIEPLLNALGELLRPNGRFVFALSHPCFLPPGAVHVAEEAEDEGEIVTRYSVKVSAYIAPKAHRGLALRHQPAPQYYFHRPLHVLFGACFAAGFVLDGLAEPTFPPGQDARHALSWDNFHALPPVLAARLRRP